MKKNGILNSELAKVAADLGHTDLVCIGDCGLPVPQGVKKIDLALEYGMPTFQAVFQNYLEYVVVEKIFLAEEIKKLNPQQLLDIKNALPQNVEIEFVPHIKFKEMTRDVKAVIRTGEITPFSNVIMQSGAIAEFNL